MGGGVPSSGRRPSHAAYFVALGGVLALLLLLCCYFLYFFVRKVHELRDHPSLTALPNNPVKPLITPAVREGATAMARLCRRPAAPGGAVFPAGAPGPPAPLPPPVVVDKPPPPPPPPPPQP